MKKKIIAVALLCLAIGQNVFAERPIKLFVGGEEVIPDVAPIIINNRTMMPVRAVFEAIGAEVNYDAASKRVTAELGDKKVEMTIDSDVMKVNGQEKTIDSPAIIKDNRTLVPLRACAEAFDLEVEWRGASRKIKIKKEITEVKSMTAPQVGTTIYTYDEDGNLIKTESKDSVSEYIYENGLLVSIKHSSGIEETFRYNEQEDLIVWKNNRGKMRQYNYDENGDCLGFSQPDYKFEIRTFDDKRRVTTYRNSEGADEKYTYDDKGNIIYTEKAGGAWEKNTYDEKGRLLVYETSTGIKMEYSYREDGKISQIVTDRGVEKYRYSDDGLRCTVEGPGGNVNITYDEKGNIASTSSAFGMSTKYIQIYR